jgi:hypothetical protein
MRPSTEEGHDDATDDRGSERDPGIPGQADHRLVDVKTAVDPDNVFHHNQNIRPDRRA